MTLHYLLKITFILTSPKVANFTDIVKIGSAFIIATFKDSKNVKATRNYVLKCNLYLYLLM